MKIKKNSASPDRTIDWPSPARPEAFHGVIGEFIECIAKQTEADPHSILLHALAMFGNILGRTAHFSVGATQHYLNLFVAVVGQTSSGRKGMARDLALSMMSAADPSWARPTTGLSSGEGLIYAVRDPMAKPMNSANAMRGKKRKTEILDAGVADKRLIVIEPELGAVLQIMKRPGNTLSAVVRQAWDGDTLQVASRNTAAKATDPHISIVGHITLEELTQSLDDVSMFNGFANRFVWALTKRSGRLPEGGRIIEGTIANFRIRIHKAVTQGRRVGEMKRSDKARILWDQEYDRLSDDKRGGFLSAVTARAAPYVMRFACCYSLLDGSPVVQASHLRSALALWDYCDASARHVFGARLGQRDADRLLRELKRRRDEGLTRTEIFKEIFQRHRSRDDIEHALRHLADQGLARFETRATDGRPEERWFAV